MGQACEVSVCVCVEGMHVCVGFAYAREVCLCYLHVCLCQLGSIGYPFRAVNRQSKESYFFLKDLKPLILSSPRSRF